MSEFVFRVVTGWYPSKNTAERILSKVKAHFKGAFIQEDTGFYTIVIGTYGNYECALRVRENCIARKVYCGIEVL